jgi:hypothetical protein
LKTLAVILKSPRTWGLAGTAVVLYFLVFVVFGKLDMSWIMPDTNQIARSITVAWQDLPFFAVKKVSADDGNGHYIYYTVPTRQFTPKQLAQMGVTNAVAHPVAPK